MPAFAGMTNIKVAWLLATRKHGQTKRLSRMQAGRIRLKKYPNLLVMPVKTGIRVLTRCLLSQA